MDRVRAGKAFYNLSTLFSPQLHSVPSSSHREGGLEALRRSHAPSGSQYQQEGEEAGSQCFAPEELGLDAGGRGREAVEEGAWGSLPRRLLH